MKHIFAGAGAVLACWIVAPTAQQTPAPVNEPAHKIFVLTGCLEGSAGANSVFKLTGGSPIGQPPSSAAGTSATAGPRGDYLLQPASGLSEQGVNREQLQGHVGKRVEVTIRPAELPSPPAPPSSQTAETTSKAKELPPQRYTVVRISRLADACS